MRNQEYVKAVLSNKGRAREAGRPSSSNDQPRLQTGEPTSDRQHIFAAEQSFKVKVTSSYIV
jgi:hypothetical protein